MRPKAKLSQQKEGLSLRRILILSVLFSLLSLCSALRLYDAFGLKKLGTLLIALPIHALTSVIGWLLIWKRPERAEGKTDCFLFALLLAYAWIGIFDLPNKILLFLSLLLLLASATFPLVFALKRMDPPTFELIFPWILLLLGVLLFTHRMERYTCLNDLFQNKFFYLTLILSVSATLASYPILKRHLPKAKKKKAQKKQASEFVLCLLAVFVAAVIAFASMLNSINITFDPSEPVSRSVSVQDMHWNSSKGNTTYRLLVPIDGAEVWLHVSSNIYFDTAIGENVTVDIYAGALKEPYGVVQGK